LRAFLRFAVEKAGHARRAQRELRRAVLQTAAADYHELVIGSVVDTKVVAHF
jgi:hypothetical protein